MVDVLQKDLVIYEMNVRAFTADESSGIDPAIGGSYLGVIEKVIVYHLTAHPCLHLMSKEGLNLKAYHDRY